MADEDDIRPFSIDEVRPGAADLEAILEIEHGSFSNPWTAEMFRAEIEHTSVSRVYAVRAASGRVVAFCTVWLVFDEVHINNLAVHPTLRRRGLGIALLRHVLREGARQGARRATLEVRRSNLAALELYRTLGFAVAGTRRAYYTNPNEDALILWRNHLETLTPDNADPTA
jgi:ribosomal-protein-alanine N-acetyltransferase